MILQLGKHFTELSTSFRLNFFLETKQSNLSIHRSNVNVNNMLQQLLTCFATKMKNYSIPKNRISTLSQFAAL